jgi:hypothetical protein
MSDATLELFIQLCIEGVTGDEVVFFWQGASRRFGTGFRRRAASTWLRPVPLGVAVTPVLLVLAMYGRIRIPVP